MEFCRHLRCLRRGRVSAGPGMPEGRPDSTHLLRLLDIHGHKSPGLASHKGRESPAHRAGRPRRSLSGGVILKLFAVRSLYDIPPQAIEGTTRSE